MSFSPVPAGAAARRASLLSRQSRVMRTPPKVTLVVLNWNGLADTSECLDCLGAVTYPNYQTIVVDNGSSGDDAKALQERFGDSARVIARPENLGFAGGGTLAMAGGR